MSDPKDQHDAKSEAPRIRALRTLRQWIENGALPAGEPLPPERELSRKLQVGRATLQRALAVLQAEGLIRFHGGHTRLVNGSRHAGGAARSAVALLSFFRDPQLSGRDAWSEATCRGALEETRRKGWNALSFYLDSMSLEEIVQVAADHPLGVLIPEANYPHDRIPVELLHNLAERSVRFVLCGDWAQWEPFDRVYSDHEIGGYQVTRWLVERGCRRILMLWPEPHDVWWAQQRRRGYERALEESGISPLPLQKMVPLYEAGVGGDASAERFEAQSRYFAGYLIDHLRNGDSIDAVVLPTDAHAFPLAAACRHLGRTPNVDVLIGGYDNDWISHPWRKMEPAGPLVTVDRLNAELGREMVRLLSDRTSGKLPQRPEARAIMPTIVVLGGVGAVPEQLTGEIASA